MMHDRWSGGSQPRSRSRAIAAALALGLCGSSAWAVPPSIPGSVIEIDEGAATQLVNLRDQGVIDGTAPARITVQQVTINGFPPDVFSVTAVPGNTAGAVCLSIDNSSGEADLASDVVEVEFTVTNLSDPSLPATARLQLTGIGGTPPGDTSLAACSDPNQSPVANAGPDQLVADSDGLPGESVTLDGSGSIDPDGALGGIIRYDWMDALGNHLATGANPTVNLADGVHILTLVVTDNSGDSATDTASDTVQITVEAPLPDRPPVANAGPDQSVPDTDALPGELVQLDGSASTDADGTIVSYVWSDASGNQLATGATPTVALPDGTSVITLTVTDDCGAPCDFIGQTDSDTVTITVAAPSGNAPPIADAGGDRTVNDTDFQPGEDVTLDGSASSDADGTIVSYQWFDAQENALGSGPIVSVRLPDGDNVITLFVTDDSGDPVTETGFTSVTISVGVPPQRTTLEELPNLKPNQRNVARTLDDLCPRLAEADEQAPLVGDQRDLLDRCNGVIFQTDPTEQVRALDELGAQDLNAIRRQALLFANFNYVGVMDRLIALRGGASGLSLAGLNLSIDGSPVPLDAVLAGVRALLGGGASADEEPGGLLDERLGIWARGNYSFGEKDASSADNGFEADQWGLTVGIDYRLSDRTVIGAAGGYGKSDISFEPSGEGGLDASSWALSLYGSAYVAENFYLDGVINYSRSDYDARRRISYTDLFGLVERTARGDTDGSTISGGVSIGYDFLIGGLTVSPTASYFYVDTTIDEFVEAGSGGLDLAYDEQSYQSATGSLGLRVAYAWNLSWGVLLPHFRGEFVREFEDDVEVFGVRFANDPFAGSSNPTPPIIVQSDEPDQSYWRLAVGFAAQFPYGVSGYVEYQRLEGFEFLQFNDVTVGLRMQHSFR